LKKYPELNKSKDVYQSRWEKSLSSGDYDLLSTDNLDTQVKFFYDQYCNFILEKIKSSFSEKKLKKLRILEFGCGRGTASIFLSKRLKCPIVGIDFSDVSIEIARKNALKHNVNVDFFVADIFDINSRLKDSIFVPESYDVIISLGVLEHIEFIEDCFKIHNSLLKKNGLVCAMIVPEKKSIQDNFLFINKFLLLFARLFKSKSLKNLSYLDTKTLSKTKDVYRSYEKASFFEKNLKKANFRNVSSFESNPFPTLRPLTIFLDKGVVIIYKLIIVFLNYFRKNIFFNCDEKISRCHFLLGYKK